MAQLVEADRKAKAAGKTAWSHKPVYNKIHRLHSLSLVFIPCIYAHTPTSFV